ncbi:hypothetical protein PILCRDRAFT_816997 [Piloderma croceum F 1598]|uniref:Uncharacterized protein n=1 Tax=Piloderma croceum (strain F 1598) TaxID=765440 RepID=A0A0C3C7X1_PILCF|nr:hypothetical protein PILCRDRAFT_816997 [Piloderma croceum F 1598]
MSTCRHHGEEVLRERWPQHQFEAKLAGFMCFITLPAILGYEKIYNLRRDNSITLCALRELKGGSSLPLEESKHEAMQVFAMFSQLAPWHPWKGSEAPEVKDDTHTILWPSLL